MFYEPAKLSTLPKQNALTDLRTSVYLRRRMFPSDRRFLNEIVAFVELFCVITLLASPSNHYYDNGTRK